REVILAPPPWARRLRAALDRGQQAVLFIDELTCMPPSVQAAFLRVGKERDVADVSLGGMAVIAAANPVEDSQGYDLSAAMGGRWCHVRWRVDPDDWVAGELGGWGAPDAALTDARADVCA